MRELEERLVSRWSPYELNGGAILIFGLLGATCLAGIALLPGFAIAITFVPLLVGLAAAYWLMLIGLCPSCNKSPMLRQYGQGKLAVLLRHKRAWPERRCSSCGHDLTEVAE
jgi:hypothetical protein